MNALPRTHLVTVAEFERMEDDRRLELIDGEIVERPVPTKKHRDLQDRLAELLKAKLSTFAVRIELEFRPMPEYTLPKSDVAAVAWDRWAATPDDGYLAGAPELVVEVLSGSNTAYEINHKRHLCLRSGCLAFWAIDMNLRIVEVSTPDRQSRSYGQGEVISLTSFGADSLAVDEIFAGIFKD